MLSTERDRNRAVGDLIDLHDLWGILLRSAWQNVENGVACGESSSTGPAWPYRAESWREQGWLTGIT